MLNVSCTMNASKAMHAPVADQATGLNNCSIPVVIHTRHPLIACLIETVLKTDQRLPQFAIVGRDPSPLLTHPEAIVIIDAFTIRSWRKQLSIYQGQNCRSIVLMMPNRHDDSEVLEACSLGARGIIDMRRGQREELQTAIREVMEGHAWISPALSQSCSRHRYRLRTQMASLSETLTARERDVMGMVTKGLANKQIAGALNISARTVKFHVSNILRKGKVKNRRDLVILKQP